MHDMGKPFHFHQPFNLNSSGSGNASKIITAKINKHDVFGPFLGIFSQFGSQPGIFNIIPAPSSGSCNGRKLKQASAGRQIICVTHLAQVAAFADTHLLIAKTVRDGRTFTTVNALPQEERVQELARIMGGENLTPTVLASARELILQAKENDNGR